MEPTAWVSKQSNAYVRFITGSSLRGPSCVERIIARLDRRRGPLAHTLSIQFCKPIVVALGQAASFVARRLVQVALRLLACSSRSLGVGSREGPPDCGCDAAFALVLSGVSAGSAIEGPRDCAETARRLGLPDSWRLGRALERSLVGETNAGLAIHTCLWVFFDVHDYLVDDEDLVGGERADHGPEDRNRGAKDSDVDFEDAEYVHNGSVIGHIEDGNSASPVDAESDHAAYRNYSYTREGQHKD